jgi:hypothetical protein
VTAGDSCSVLRTSSGSADHDSNTSILKNTQSQRGDTHNVATENTRTAPPQEAAQSPL